MCGIAGIVGDFSDWHLPALERMVEAQRHRGPDGDGIQWIQCGDTHLGLGHRRLAIQDLSDAGRQPMVHPHSGDVLVFNGEIYNSPELGQRLSREGVTFRGHSDTEVLLHALRNWGIECLRELNGMYAFAWFDRERRKLLLARDPLGIKPLYLSHINGAFLFASEVGSLIASGQVSTELDPVGLASLLAYGSTQAPHTVFRDVRVFPAGHWQEFEITDKLCPGAMHSHWAFPPVGSSPSHEDDVASVRQLLTSSVQSHMLSDVPVGVFLSSGIDSTIVASLAAQHQSNVQAFTVGFADAADHSEASLAKKTASTLGMSHQTLWLSQNDALHAVNPWLDSLDLPSMDGLNTYVISKCVRDAGIVVALSGQGGDELFGGYPSFLDVPRLLRIVRWLRTMPAAMRSPIIRLLSLRRGVVFREKLTNMLAIGGDVTGLALQRRRCFSDSQIADLLCVAPGADDVRNHYLEPSEYAELPISAADPVHAVSILESKFYLGNTLLPVGDTNGMSHGLEIRVPMLDRPLLNRVLRIPGSSRLPDRIANKALLRNAFPEFLRPELANQTKRGFVLPVKRWMLGPLRPVCETALTTLRTHPSFRADGVDQVWNAFLKDPENSIWSRAWLLVALGNYLQRVQSVPPVGTLYAA